jgi:hypothetical protein
MARRSKQHTRRVKKNKRKTIKRKLHKGGQFDINNITIPPIPFWYSIANNNTIYKSNGETVKIIKEYGQKNNYFLVSAIDNNDISKKELGPFNSNRNSDNFSEIVNFKFREGTEQNGILIPMVYIFLTNPYETQNKYADFFIGKSHNLVEPGINHTSEMGILYNNNRENFNVENPMMQNGNEELQKLFKQNLSPISPKSPKSPTINLANVAQTYSEETKDNEKYPNEYPNEQLI